MIFLKFRINEQDFQKSLTEGINAIGSQNTFRLIGKAVLGQMNLLLNEEVKSGKILRYSAKWFRPNVFLDRQNPSLINLSQLDKIDLGYYVVDVVTKREPPCFLEIESSENFYWKGTVKIFTKALKSECKSTIRLVDVGIGSSLLRPVVEAYDYPCGCSPDYLVPYINGVWDYALQFICKVCGKTYMCECFRQAIEKKYREIVSNKSDLGMGSHAGRIVSTFEQSEFRVGICHLCRDITSELHYCHPEYGSNVLVHYGPYIAKTAIEKGIDQREAENEIREFLGIPRIGEGWISEVELLNLVKQLFPDQEVLHHFSPEWLGRQHLDIFLPDKNLAIEYQGRQHFEPVEFFGGMEGYEKTLTRDRHKAELCASNGISLIYFRFDEIVSKQLIEERIEYTKHYRQ